MFNHRLGRREVSKFVLNRLSGGTLYGMGAFDLNIGTDGGFRMDRADGGLRGYGYDRPGRRAADRGRIHV